MDKKPVNISIKRAHDVVFLRSLEAELDELLDYMLATPPKTIPVDKTMRLIWLEDQIKKVKNRSNL